MNIILFINFSSHGLMIYFLPASEVIGMINV